MKRKGGINWNLCIYAFCFWLRRLFIVLLFVNGLKINLQMHISICSLTSFLILFVFFCIFEEKESEKISAYRNLAWCLNIGSMKTPRYKFRSFYFERCSTWTWFLYNKCIFEWTFRYATIHINCCSLLKCNVILKVRSWCLPSLSLSSIPLLNNRLLFAYNSFPMVLSLVQHRSGTICRLVHHRFVVGSLLFLLAKKMTPFNTSKIANSVQFEEIHTIQSAGVDT